MPHEIGDERAEELLKMWIDKCISIRGKGFADKIQEFKLNKALVKLKNCEKHYFN